MWRKRTLPNFSFLFFSSFRVMENKQNENRTADRLVPFNSIPRQFSRAHVRHTFGWKLDANLFPSLARALWKVHANQLFIALDHDSSSSFSSTNSQVWSTGVQRTLHVLHNSEQPASAFAILESGNKVVPLIADGLFDLLMYKISSVYTNKMQKMESKGPRFEIGDFCVKLGSVTINQNFKGVLVEVRSHLKGQFYNYSRIRYRLVRYFTKPTVLVYLFYTSRRQPRRSTNIFLGRKKEKKLEVNTEKYIVWIF